MRQSSWLGPMIMINLDIRPAALAALIAFATTHMDAQVVACANSYRPNEVAIEKAVQRSEQIVKEITTHHLEESWPARRKKLQKRLKVDQSHEVRNDLAV